LLSEQHILIFLVQVFLLLGLAKALGELFRSWKQPVITAEILAGVLLGPTIFGRLIPAWYRQVFPTSVIQQDMLETVAWLGLLFFLLEAGLKMDFSTAWRHRGKALTIALTDIIVPMAIGFICCYLLPARFLVDPNQRVLFSLFMATALTISAMSIAIRTLSDLNMEKTDLGFLIMSALSVNEIIGWMIFSLVLGLFVQAQPQLGRLTAVFIAAIAFTAFCLTLGRRFADAVIRKIKARGMPEPGTSLTFICLLGFLCGAVFQSFGMHALLGFFLAGVVAGEARALPERTRHVISQMVYALFVPLFFARIGLGIDFLKNFDPFLVIFVTCLGILGKFIGAWLGVSLTTLPRVNRLSVAVAHTPGGEMEIVAGMLALKYRLISAPMFEAIVFGAIASAVLLGPWLKFSLRRRKVISILEFFSRREIVAELKAVDRDSAIRELCLVAYEQANMPDVDSLSAAVLSREESMGTAVEEGVALPHARIPSLIRPVVVFGRSSSGIEWDSPDGVASRFIFLILTPREDDDIQVQILRIIALSLSYKKTRLLLAQAPSGAQIWEVLQDSFTRHQVVRRESSPESLQRD
jgi:Kef-type K+ transport system membrane component KefB/mannitol/fructose-specific phosphotransferase system IIA component (Ntr-type)